MSYVIPFTCHTYFPYFMCLPSQVFPAAIRFELGVKPVKSRTNQIIEEVTKKALDYWKEVEAQRNWLYQPRP